MKKLHLVGTTDARCPICWQHFRPSNISRHYESCKRNTPEIHTTDRQVWKSCRQRWDYSSNLRMNLEPIAPVENFKFGSAIHEAISAYYESGLRHEPDGSYGADTQKRSMAPGHDAFDLAIKAWYGEVESPSDEQDERFDDLREMGHSMLTQWEHFAVVNDNFECLWTERTFHIPMLVPTRTGRSRRRVVYSFRTDGLYRDDHDRLWIGEWKTTSVMPNPPEDTDYLMNDDQVGAYIAALNQLDEVKALGRIEGVLYRWLKKKVPSHMKPLASKPTLSLDKRIDTTYEIAVADIRAHHDGRVPPAYKEFLDHIKAKGNTFIKQEFVRRNAHEIEYLWESLPFEIAEMVNAPRIYRTPSRFNCNGCAYLVPCLTRWEGRDDSDLLADGFQQRDNRYAMEVPFAH